LVNRTGSHVIGTKRVPEQAENQKEPQENRISGKGDSEEKEGVANNAKGSREQAVNPGQLPSNERINRSLRKKGPTWGRAGLSGKRKKVHESIQEKIGVNILFPPPAFR